MYFKLIIIIKTLMYVFIYIVYRVFKNPRNAVISRCDDVFQKNVWNKSCSIHCVMYCLVQKKCRLPFKILEKEASPEGNFFWAKQYITMNRATFISNIFLRNFITPRYYGVSGLFEPPVYYTTYLYFYFIFSFIKCFIEQETHELMHRKVIF